MFHQFIPPGPNTVPEPSTKIDRTQILDPKDYWRDPATCPDWPALTGTQRYDGPRGKVGAEQRLQAIGQYLNRGPGTLRAPTPDERDQHFSATFRRTGSPWHHLGLNELSPLGRMVEGEAELMAEACHLRGYLRKLEVKAAASAEADEHRRLSEARRTLDEYRFAAAADVAEIEALAEAVARHQQREEDEKAVARTYSIRQQLSARHSAAVQAAHTLGLGVPDAPEVLG
ncbi:hypothetical protein [Sphingomonas sp. UBA978]|uniref:hypothetical protein n=1 Tax=Sphingomonas sp. UBA978 TaxID=1947536 RepID=UPI0025EFF7A6|nr:hypothetical protein [Sphingomonas sp. UBA978]